MASMVVEVQVGIALVGSVAVGLVETQASPRPSSATQKDEEVHEIEIKETVDGGMILVVAQTADAPSVGSVETSTFPLPSTAAQKAVEVHDIE